ncbi:dihydroneopterin aldolase [Subtercola boreus]|nr:dihydroneopterin aldolase [Subtercola boreus]
MTGAVPASSNLTRVPDELDSLTLTGLTVQANHGVYDHERRDGQPFVIDLTVWLDTAAAAASDDLDQTLNYGILAKSVHDAVAADPVDLLETLAERVAGVALASPIAERVRVTVHKPEAPITVPFTDVSITITRRRA